MAIERYTSLKDRIQAGNEKDQVIKYPEIDIIDKEGKDGSPPLVILKSEASFGSDKHRKFGEYAIVTRDRINAKEELEGTDLEIQCPTMQAALCSIFGENSSVGIRADPIIFRKPYYSLFQRRLEIHEMAQSPSNTPEETKRFDWLVKFMAKNFEALETVQTGLVGKSMIQFKHLPIIFEPGGVIVSSLQGEEEGNIKRENLGEAKRPECFLFHQISDEMEDAKKGGKYMELDVFRWGYNGSGFGLVPHRLQIQEFSDTRPIRRLGCYPLKCLPEEEIADLVPKLIKRGKDWCKYVKATHLDYNGVALSPVKSTWSWGCNIVQKNMPGRVVLDHLAFVEAYPELNKPLQSKFRGDGKDSVRDATGPTDCTPGWKIHPNMTLPPSHLWDIPPKEGYTPTDGQALLCPAYSTGYSLVQKDWGYFDIDSLQPIRWSPKPLEGLEIKEVLKESLLALIREHYSKNRTDKIVPTKGEGLIFLLDGPAGCGKTLTAERMAEEVERALLRISCSDLGDNPYDVERKLDALLKLAIRCEAIVLVDEADTFLSRRSSGSGGSIADYFHNAIVSIFLQRLEYFSGVIFLTTNSVTAIDDAVKSRAISLRYTDLQSKSRSKIWMTHLVKGQEIPADQDMWAMCTQLGEKYKLDGRQIMTLARLSLNFCRQEKKHLTKEVIERMYNLFHGKEFANI